MAPTIERIGSGCPSNPMRVLIRLTAPTDLFEISYAGMAVIGFGTEEAAERWITSAITQLSIGQLEALS